MALSYSRSSCPYNIIISQRCSCYLLGDKDWNIWIWGGGQKCSDHSKFLEEAKILPSQRLCSILKMAYMQPPSTWWICCVGPYFQLVHTSHGFSSRSADLNCCISSDILCLQASGSCLPYKFSSPSKTETSVIFSLFSVFNHPVSHISVRNPQAFRQFSRLLLSCDKNKKVT